MSTEFTVGLSANQRISSKVLKPPGGGSSNIFGFTDSKEEEKKPVPAFEAPVTAVEPMMLLKTVTAPATLDPMIVPKSAKKKQVMRNPITGEEVEINQKENVEDDESEKQVVRNPITGEIVKVLPKQEKAKDEEKTMKPLVTSIRVKNPPGGKSTFTF